MNTGLTSECNLNQLHFLTPANYCKFTLSFTQIHFVQNPILLHDAKTPDKDTPTTRLSPTEMTDFRYLAVGDIKGTYIVRQKTAKAHHRAAGEARGEMKCSVMAPESRSCWKSLFQPITAMNHWDGKGLWFPQHTPGSWWSSEHSSFIKYAKWSNERGDFNWARMCPLNFSGRQ